MTILDLHKVWVTREARVYLFGSPLPSTGSRKETLRNMGKWITCIQHWWYLTTANDYVTSCIQYCILKCDRSDATWTIYHLTKSSHNWVLEQWHLVHGVSRLSPLLYFVTLTCWDLLTALTHWGRDKMAAISQTTLSNAFSWMKMLDFRLKFHWSSLSEPMMVRLLTHICVTRPQWVTCEWMSRPTTINSANDLSPVQCQTFTRTNADLWQFDPYE